LHFLLLHIKLLGSIFNVMEILKLSRVKMVVLCMLLFALGACSLTEPFVDRRREAGRPKDNLYVGSSKPDAPVVCYNGLITKFDEVQKMADAECVKHDTGISARLDDEEIFACRIMTPTKAKFQCVR